MDLFARIYCDTNLLLRGGWPAANSALAEIASLVLQLNARVFIPAVVESEIEGVWKREVYEVHNDDEVTRRTRGIIRDGVFAPVNWEIVAQDYREAAARFKGKWSVDVVP